MSYQHWKFEQDEHGVAWLYCDRQGTSANTLNEAVLQELAQILDQLSDEASLYKALIIASAKSSGFIMGADIDQFRQMTSPEQAYQAIRQVHAVFDKLAALTIPTVAMIKGFCLGGGSELSLACDYRVVEESRQTRIAFPEVKLGIHPGWGGMVRAPRVMGGIKAMDLILSGRMITGKQAYNMGFASVAVPDRELKRAATMVALRQAKPTSKKTWLDKLSNSLLMRYVLARVMSKKLQAKVKEKHYPAPYAALAHWRQYGGSKSQAAFEAEAQSVAKLIAGETAQNLIRVFFLQDRMKKLSKASDFKAKHVHVVGAGTMGGDIAAWCAFRGLTVTLQDREAKMIAPAIKRAHAFFQKKLKKAVAIQSAMDKLIPDVEGIGMAHADVVIEAIFEDLKTKQDLFQQLEAKMKPDAIMASNTSSILLEDISQVLKNPTRLVGIHFFNPVTVMPLVEVVKGQQTAQKVLDAALSFVGQLSKQPIEVKSSPGFLVNRCLMPYLLEAVALLSEGIDAKSIDEAAEDFGMPMGPIELADTVGLDICLHVAENLVEQFGGTIPAKLKLLVEEGKLGKKSDEGFYRFEKGKAIKPNGSSSLTAMVIQRRLISRMIAECEACLSEGIISDKDMLDAGMIFGTGFAPFRGGPIHYAEREQMRQ